MTQVDLERTGSSADVRAREVEEQLTDDERFSLVISIFGHVPGSATGGPIRASRRTSPT
jgi:beta-glucosidase